MGLDKQIQLGRLGKRNLMYSNLKHKAMVDFLKHQVE